MTSAAPESPAKLSRPVEAATLTASADDKAVAVLPFANLSGDPAQEYFSDGFTEEILNTLARERDLRVPGRASAFSFKNTKSPPAEIARALKVTRLVEGSVQRIGNHVRIRVQLTRASDGFSEALGSFDKEMTDGAAIFALQDEVARAVVEKMTRRKLTSGVAVLTNNLEAYDLLLKAREIKNGPISVHLGSLPQVQQLLERAVELDPRFLTAWVELVAVRSMRIYTRGTERGNPLYRDGAKQALEMAQRLAPDSIEVVKARGEFLYRCERNYAQAAAEWEKIPRLYPNDSEGWYSMAIAFRRLGRWPEALENFRRVAKLDPANLRNLEDFRATLLAVRRYDEALVISRRVLALGPVDSLEFAAAHALIPLDATGSTAEMEMLFKNLPPAKATGQYAVTLQRSHAIRQGDKATAKRLSNEPLPAGLSGFARASDDALVFAVLGDRAGVAQRASEVMAKLKEAVERQPDEAGLRIYLARLNAFLGNQAEAVAQAAHAIAIFPEKDDAVYGPRYSLLRAQVLAWAGDKDRAIAELGRLLRLPYGPNIHEMRTSLWYEPLRGDPRFEALLNDPKNNAPLF